MDTYVCVLGTRSKQIIVGSESIVIWNKALQNAFINKIFKKSATELLFYFALNAFLTLCILHVTSYWKTNASVSREKNIIVSSWVFVWDYKDGK